MQQSCELLLAIHSGCLKRNSGQMWQACAQTPCCSSMPLSKRCRYGPARLVSTSADQHLTNRRVLDHCSCNESSVKPGPHRVWGPTRRQLSCLQATIPATTRAENVVISALSLVNVSAVTGSSHDSDPQTSCLVYDILRLPAKRTTRAIMRVGIVSNQRDGRHAHVLLKATEQQQQVGLHSSRSRSVWFREYWVFQL
jgi:hypothetical protein